MQILKKLAHTSRSRTARGMAKFHLFRCLKLQSS